MVKICESDGWTLTSICLSTILPFSSFLSFSEGEIGQAKDTEIEKGTAS